MEDFFSYKWSEDKNLALKSEQDLKIFEQLPTDVQTKIYVTFLFSDLSNQYGVYFQLRNFVSSERASFYQWDNDIYRYFFYRLFSSLEPRHEHKDAMLVDHLDELSEVLFITEGYYDVIGCVNHNICLDPECSVSEE